MTRFSELAYHLVQLSFISYNMLYVKGNIKPFDSKLVIRWEKYLMLKGRLERNADYIFPLDKICSEKKAEPDYLALPLSTSPFGIGWFSAYLIRSDPLSPK